MSTVRITPEPSFSLRRPCEAPECSELVISVYCDVHLREHWANRRFEAAMKRLMDQ